MIRIGSRLGLMLSFTSALGCEAKSGGQADPKQIAADFSTAACECWNLLNLGDAYFPSKEACLNEAAAFAMVFMFTENECTLAEIQKIPELKDDLNCHLDALEQAIPCFEDLTSCDYDNEAAWSECFITAGGAEQCGYMPIEMLIDRLYPVCQDR